MKTRAWRREVKGRRRQHLSVSSLRQGVPSEYGQKSWEPRISQRLAHIRARTSVPDAVSTAVPCPV